jgi:hypothetical protein
VILITIDWTAAATLALAAITVVLAGFTGWSAHEASRSVDEVRKDRELSARPVIVFRHESQSHGQPEKQISVLLANIGNGPALTCRFVAVHFARLGDSDGEPMAMKTAYHRWLPPLGPGAKEDIGVPQSIHALTDIALAGMQDELGWTEVVLCSDVLGQKHRYFRRFDGILQWESDAGAKRPLPWTAGW